MFLITCFYPTQLNYFTQYYYTLSKITLAIEFRETSGHGAIFRKILQLSFVPPKGMILKLGEFSWKNETHILEAEVEHLGMIIEKKSMPMLGDPPIGIDLRHNLNSHLGMEDDDDSFWKQIMKCMLENGWSGPEEAPREG